MRRWLACLLVCAVAVGCDGETTGDDGQPGAALGDGEVVEPAVAQRAESEAVTPASAGEESFQRARSDSKIDEPTLPGIGDGETGGRAGIGGRDAGIAPPPSPTPRPGPTAAAPRGASAEGATAAKPSGSTGRAVDSDSAGVRAPSAPSGGFTPGTGPSLPVAPTDGRAMPPGILPPGRPPVTQVPIRPGTLTAGTWDDNRNFDFFQRYRASVAQNLNGILPFSDAEFVTANAKFSKPQGARQRLDIALVIDTTGSMGDEISYLQSELLAISRTIELAYPQSEQRWALVVYRDEGDEYTTRYFDFRSNPAELRDKLAAQRASGGGDFPEAPQAAFAIMNQFAWRTSDNVARLAFWVADAPHHAPQAANLAKTIRDAQSIGVHVYPVASSGIDELTELTMRSSAQLTGGRYLFLTDDSRVGNSHKEPTIPCYFVTKLDEAIFRSVSYEMSGIYREPDAQQVIRTSGDPQRGICRLSSGQNVQIF